MWRIGNSASTGELVIENSEQIIARYAFIYCPSQVFTAEFIQDYKHL